MKQRMWEKEGIWPCDEKRSDHLVRKGKCMISHNSWEMEGA